ncbi:MAG: thermonuclease family protein [Candidatus Glassbacteria bacterium]|nr:thermonuclease family protein [Candidatus Glassbacteria bacterium]
MQEVADESVHLVVTSPPYWQLKDYGGSGQIGFHHSYQDYINSLNLVWHECLRVLHRGCRLCINLGDQFARSVYYGRYKVIPIRTEVIRFCETVGFDYMGAVIWQKVTTTNTTGGATVMGSYPYPRNGILKIDYEFILVFRKPGRPPQVAEEVKESSKLSSREWNEYFSGHWNFPGEKQKKHLAMFPEELPRRLIRMFTFAGDTVLDPFLGSGTTCLAAMHQGRSSVGYEVNGEFLPVIEEKLGINRNLLFEDYDFEVVRQEARHEDHEKALKKLPYIFRDLVKFDKRVDPRKFRFGSRVGSPDAGREEYFRVREVVSPEVLDLDDGSRIRLLGVRVLPGKEREAADFIRQTTAGRQVFLKFDTMRHDDQGNLFCYLYLKNRTFINAHLIKKGLAAADTSVEYSCRNRFEKM